MSLAYPVYVGAVRLVKQWCKPAKFMLIKTSTAVNPTNPQIGGLTTDMSMHVVYNVSNLLCCWKDWQPVTILREL